MQTVPLDCLNAHSALTALTEAPAPPPLIRGMTEAGARPENGPFDWLFRRNGCQIQGRRRGDILAAAKLRPRPISNNTVEKIRTSSILPGMVTARMKAAMRRMNVMNIATSTFRRVDQSALDWLGTDPIPAKPYHDPDFFELERAAVFMRSWIVIGHVCELPDAGSFIRRDLEFANASLLIVRDRKQEIRAFYNVCTHRGTQLVREAQGQRSAFTCPYHMWTFGTDGALLSAPDFEAFHVKKQDCSLPTVRVEVIAGLIFVNFDEKAEPLRQELGDFFPQLEATPLGQATTFLEYSYEIESNWKLCYDNFQENYHLRFIHPRTGYAGVGAENPFGYPIDYHFNGPHRGQKIWYNLQAPSKGVVQQTAAERALDILGKKGLLGQPAGDQYFALFPNSFILGNPLQNFLHVVYPISAGRSRGVIRLFWVGEPENASEAFSREFYLTMLREVHGEDINVIEGGYRGLASGGLKHIHFQTQEVLCRHLHNMVMEKVGEYQRQIAENGQ